MSRKIVIAVTGASGAIYAEKLLSALVTLSGQWEKAAVVFSKNAVDVWEYELKKPVSKFKSIEQYNTDDFFAPFASGSAGFDTMIICPCSMGTLARIASGYSDSLITRAADVMLKERRKLIVVPRETPYSLIHLQNMLTLTQAGAIICPANPSFYSMPASVDELCNTVVERVLTLAGFNFEHFSWGNV